MMMMRRIERKHKVSVIRKKKMLKLQKYQSLIGNGFLSSEQKRLIDGTYGRLLLSGVKHKYDWHLYYMKCSPENTFCEDYFPEDLYAACEYVLNGQAEKMAYSNKILQSQLLSNYTFVLTPKIYIYSKNGCFFSSNYKQVKEKEAVEIISSAESAFVKPIADSNSGKGCYKVNCKNDIEINNLVEEMKNNNIVIQEVIENKKSIKQIHPSSLNTFRVFSYRIGNSVYVAPITLRVGRNKKKC